MPEPVISVSGLRKSYGDFEAVRGIDIEVQRGEVFAFLGPNGAGKTTTVEILEGYRERSEGDVAVLGADPARPRRAWRARLGIVLQECELTPELTVREAVTRYAGYYPAPRQVDETVELVGLTAKADTRTSKLSGGQQRRLDVALALVGDPELLFLDEPTTGFDPSARRQAWDVIGNLRDLGKTVFLTTHYMEEAQALADRAAIIVRGRIAAQGDPDELGGRAGAEAIISFKLPEGVREVDLPAPFAEAARDVAAGDAISHASAKPQPELRALLDWAAERNVDLPALEVRRPSLEDVYLRLTGEAMRSEDEREGGEAGEGGMSGVRLLLHQFRFDQKVFWRNPTAVFFTVMLPLVFLFIFNLLFGNDEIEGLGVNTSTYYVPAIITLAVISATTQSLAINLTADREAGMLKRVRGTPLPAWVFVAGRVGNALVISVLMVVLVAVIGRIVYDVTLPSDTIPEVVVSVAVGAAAFSCLGFALTAVIPTREAAPAVTNAFLLPLYFISGVFVPESEIPDGVLNFADIFPVRPFFESFFAAWDPSAMGAGFEWGKLGVVVLWGIGGLVVALVAFRWEPRR